MSEECKFYNKIFCDPCKSPTDFNECVLVKIGYQIIADKFVESIPESKKSEYVSLGFYLNNLKNQKQELISEFLKDLDYIYEGSDHLYGTPDDNIEEIKKKWEKLQ